MKVEYDGHKYPNQREKAGHAVTEYMYNTSTYIQVCTSKNTSNKYLGLNRA